MKLFYDFELDKSGWGRVGEEGGRRREGGKESNSDLKVYIPLHLPLQGKTLLSDSVFYKELRHTVLTKMLTLQCTRLCNFGIIYTKIYMPLLPHL